MKASLLLLAALLIAFVAVATSVPADGANAGEVGEIVDMDSTADFLDSDAQVVKREGRKKNRQGAKNSTGAPETAGQTQGRKGKKQRHNNNNNNNNNNNDNEEATGNQGKKNKNKNKNKDKKKPKSGKGRKAQQARPQPETPEAF